MDEAITMNTLSVVFAGVSIFIFVLIVMLNYKILLNMQDYGAAAYSMFFLRDPVRKAFKHLVIAAFVFAGASGLAIYGTFTGSPISYLVEIGVMIIFLAYLRFFWIVRNNTDIKKMKEDEMNED